MATKPTSPKPIPTPKAKKSFSEMSRLMQARVAAPVAAVKKK